MTKAKWYSTVEGCTQSDMHQEWGGRYRCDLCGYPRNGKPLPEPPRRKEVPAPDLVVVPADQFHRFIGALFSHREELARRAAEPGWTVEAKIGALEKALDAAKIHLEAWELFRKRPAASGKGGSENRAR